MIRIDRQAVAVPPSYRPDSPKLARARKLLRLHFVKPYIKRRQVRFSFDNEIYASRDVREALGNLFCSKCAYCESSIGSIEDQEVDRFCPRTFATSLGGKIDEDHYWWLTYEWSNLYASCPFCNRNKGRRFPVKGRRVRPGTVGQALAEERRLLLDPCADDPDKHLLFSDTGVVAGLTQKGRVTVDVFGLNRIGLITARRQELAMLLSEAQRGFDAGWRLESIHRVLRMISDPEQAYLGAKRQVLARELKRRTKIGAQTDEMPIDQIRIRLGQIAGRRISRKHISPVLQLLPSFVPTGDHLKRKVSEQHAREEEQASYTVASKAVKKAYFHKTRMIERVEIKNFRRIRELKLDFTRSTSQLAPWTMLLGENGVGKSSILQAIGLALIGRGYVKKLALDPAKFIRRGARSASVVVRLTNTTKPITLQITRRAFQHGTYQPKVLILGYGATRLLPRKGMPRDIVERFAKVDNLFDPFVPVGDPEQWLVSLKQRFDDYARALKELLLLLDGPEQIVRRGKQVMIETITGRIPLSQLSDGYQSVIGVTADIMRITSHYWPAMEVAEGIVLIDELGAHLHPRWRMRVVSGLRKAFPRVQFVSSTHDPLCLRGLLAGEVIVLREGEKGQVRAIIDVPSVENMRVDQLLTSEHFGLYSTIDPQLDLKFSRYYELKATGQKTPETQAELNQLRRYLDEAMVLGDDRRERMMLGAIDDYLAEERRITNTKEREVRRTAVQKRLADMWRKILPIVPGSPSSVRSPETRQ